MDGAKLCKIMMLIDYCDAINLESGKMESIVLASISLSTKIWRIFYVIFHD